ncbi:MAG: hypothetical protein EBS05_24680 [Proteobacteria bacterium]|nr:hypothetical protein [Pseudomonadota bacterium]
MSDESAPKSNRTWLYVVGIIAGLPLLYALSTGPVFVLYVRGVFLRESCAAFYWPLELLVASTGNTDSLWAYHKAWLDLTGTPY